MALSSTHTTPGDQPPCPVNGSMKGWTREAGKAWGEALQLMKVGSKYQLFVPSNLAYGEHSIAEIGPNATLIFDIELLDTKPRPTPGLLGAPKTMHRLRQKLRHRRSNSVWPNPSRPLSISRARPADRLRVAWPRPTNSHSEIWLLLNPRAHEK